MKSYYVYILTNKKDGVLYVGVTNDITRRAFEHKTSQNSSSFTAQYNLRRLVYFEETASVTDAIAREKQLKNWRRAWKVALIENDNPNWSDLSVDTTRS